MSSNWTSHAIAREIFLFKTIRSIFSRIFSVLLYLIYTSNINKHDLIVIMQSFFDFENTLLSRSL